MAAVSAAAARQNESASISDGINGINNIASMP